MKMRGYLRSVERPSSVLSWSGHFDCDHISLRTQKFRPWSGRIMDTAQYAHKQQIYLLAMSSRRAYTLLTSAAKKEVWLYGQ